MMDIYQVCNNCIMDTTDSTIKFDSKGVCIYCENFKKTVLPSWKDSDTQKLSKVVEQIKEYGKGKDFDCIIGLSGGLDSSYLAYIAKEKLGLRPLLFHVDAGWNTESAVGNI